MKLFRFEQNLQDGRDINIIYVTKTNGVYIITLKGKSRIIEVADKQESQLDMEIGLQSYDTIEVLLNNSGQYKTNKHLETFVVIKRGTDVNGWETSEL